MSLIYLHPFMAYEESFAPEPEVVETAPVEAAPVAETALPTDAPADQPQAPEQPKAEAPAELPGDTQPEDEAPVEEQPETAPAFNEADYFKTHLGEGAPTSAAELKQRLDTLQAKQITPEIEAQLGLLRDPAKLAEFAALATKDFDKLEAVEVHRQKFALDNPRLTPEAMERRFQRQFAEKYPTLADAIANPENYDGADPALLNDREDADIDAQEYRDALKAAQTEKTQQFLASQPAAHGPQLTAEQKADIAAVPKWLDEAFKDGTTLPIDLGDGEKISIPITKAADFKAAFNDPYKLIDKLTLTKPLEQGGVLNRETHALVTAFLQNPTAFVQNIAKQVRAGMPEPEPGIPLAQITNSSAAKRGAPAKAASATATPVGESNQPYGISADDWLSNPKL